MKEEITAELYNSWRQHPVTQAIFAVMAQEIDDIKDSWLHDHFHTGDDAATILLAQAKEKERALVYRALISQTADEFLQAAGAK